MSARGKKKVAVEHNLEKTIIAATALKESLKTLVTDDDPDALRDTIEGETDLKGAIAAVDISIISDEALVIGLQGMVERLKARKDRVEYRIERKRAIIEQAMQIGELDSLELPTGTLSIRNVAAKVEIFDEAQIPADYWKQQDPALDKAAINEVFREYTRVAKKAEKDKQPVPEPPSIPGVRLGNGGISLSIRRS
jgi:hypothetical protein